MASLRRLLSLSLLIFPPLARDVPAQVVGARDEQFFEKRIRPLFIEHCHKCHAGVKIKGGLRLESRESLLRGGESGPAIVAGKPEESLLILAVRGRDGLEMPPTGRLKEAQIADLVAWIKEGATWPSGSAVPATAPTTAAGEISRKPVSLSAPDEGDLAKSLQLWLRADALSLEDGDDVSIWPDKSGHGRDVAVTKGVRPDGVGMPGKFAKRSTLRKRPAVRFDVATGFASSPDRPVDIRGDASLTIVIVMNLQPHDARPPFDGVFGIGNPADSRDPGRPLAALVQINRDEDHSLRFAGGWNHDASLGKGSFKPHFGKPTILTVIKKPGPMRTTASLFINGEPARTATGGALEGRDTVPDIRHRADIGAYLGKAVGWAGSIRGDVGEVLLYNKALGDVERLAVEGKLAEKYGMRLRPLDRDEPPASFTEAEKSFWAYQPVKAPAAPDVADRDWARSPVDRFILEKLEEKHIRPAPPADRRTLLRRVAFDLTGLPPTPREVESFAADESPNAYEKVVDRLLASPQYGERWGRHWLDVVRYAETTANDANAVMRYAWRYRDYVIDALNRDLPYDRFLIEQIAGDLLPPTDSVETTARRIIATGFLMVGPKALAETDKEQSRLDIVDDQIDVVGRALLGLTLACARCHDHKFDAIRARDYYAIAGIFRSTEPFQNEVRNATMWWEFPVPRGEGKPPITVMAPREALPRDLRIHLRGNRFTLGAIAPRGSIGILDEASRRSESEASVEPEDSGRLELARRIANGQNPLTARVMVNRLWQHHFGRGLVATSDNFGVRGERPTHPELLDRLASRFVESGWSMKAMHRMLVTSETYRQSSEVRPEARLADPERKLLSSFPRRRLSAEEMRDAMLAVGGKLDRAAGGGESGEYLVSKAENIGAMIMPNRLAADDPIYTTYAKRAVYLPIVRNMLPDVLALFDAADPNNVTAARNETTAASQSLFLMNSPFVRTQAEALADRLLGGESRTDQERLEHAHQLAFGRTPTADEQARAAEFLDAYLGALAAEVQPERERRRAAWRSYCQTLLCSNEFLYLD